MENTYYNELQPSAYYDYISYEVVSPASVVTNASAIAPSDVVMRNANTNASNEYVTTNANATFSNDTLTTNASSIISHITLAEAEMILLPQAVIVILMMCCIVGVGLMRAHIKKRDALQQSTALNTDDLAFYQHVYKTQKSSTPGATCETQLPHKMPPVGLQDVARDTSLVPTFSNCRVIPGYVEVVRVQISPRRSTLPKSLRPTYSSPDAFHDNRPIETFGLCPRTTSSSPALMTGLWEHCRSEISRQIQDADLCPVHAGIQSSASDTSASAGRVSPPAYRGESQGFDFPRQSSGSTIPRRITCRFCRDRVAKTPLSSTPLTTPKIPHKVTGTGEISRSLSHSSVIESGLFAIAEEGCTIPSHALCSLGPIRIEHLQDLKLIQSNKSKETLEQAHASSQTEISIPLDEDNMTKHARRQSCRPEIQLENFRAIFLTSSRSGCSTTASISSSNFATVMKEDEIPEEPSTTPKSSSFDLHAMPSDHQFGSDHSISENKNDNASKLSSNQSSDHSINQTRRGQLAGSSSMQCDNGHCFGHTGIAHFSDDQLSVDTSDASKWVKIPLRSSSSEANQSQTQQRIWHSNRPGEIVVDHGPFRSLLQSSSGEESDDESDSSDELTWLQK